MRFVYTLLPILLAVGKPVADNVPFEKTKPGHDLQQQIVPQQVMVKLRSGTLKKAFVPAALQSIQKRYSITRIEPVFPDRFPVPGASDWRILHYADNRDPRDLASLLHSLPDIEIAEPRRLYPLVAIPNDSLFPQQIHLAQISAPQAWDIAKAEQGNVVIAIVDGGTELTHPDLQANLWYNPGEIPDNGLDDDQNGFIDDIHGWNFANDSGDPSPLPNQPVNGYHGTHVAGLASAVSHNRIGVSGSSWNAKLRIINGSSPTSDRSILHGLAGILYAAANGAQVINCSWGAISSPSEYEKWAIEQATALGAVVVAAAGINLLSTIDRSG